MLSKKPRFSFLPQEKSSTELTLNVEYLGSYSSEQTLPCEFYKGRKKPIICGLKGKADLSHLIISHPMVYCNIAQIINYTGILLTGTGCLFA